MSDVLQKQLEEVKAELAEAQTNNETMKAGNGNSEDRSIESQLQKFEETISAKDQAIAEVQAQVEALSKS